MPVTSSTTTDCEIWLEAKIIKFHKTFNSVLRASLAEFHLIFHISQTVHSDADF